MRQRSVNISLSCLLATTLLTAPLPAAAQQQAQGTASSGQVEEIVVTARKRTEDVQKVPESISVLSGATLTQNHILDYQDIARTVPGMSFNVGSSVLGGTIGPGSANIVIRGISSQSGSATVALYLDDTSLTESNIYDGAVDPKYVDIAQVEVQRGPQGTLFGASAMGGLVQLISNQPKFNEYETTVTLDGSGTSHGSGNYVGTLVTNIPVVDDKLAIRLAVQEGYNSGYINQYAQVSTPAMPVNNFTQAGALLHAGINWELWDTGRLSAKFQPADNLTILASIFAQYDHSGDTPVFYTESGLFATEKAVREPIEDKAITPTLKVIDSFSDFDLTSVTSYFYRNFSFQTDGTVFNDVPLATAFIDGNLAGVPGFVPNVAADDTILAGTPDRVERQNNTYDWSQEIRATSNNAEFMGHSLNWIVGLYVDAQRGDREDNQFSPGFSKEFQNIYGFGIESPKSPLSPVYFPAFEKTAIVGDEVYFDHDYLDQVQISGFTQADYEIIPNLKATAGIRYEYSHISYYRLSGGIYDAGSLTNPLTLTQKGYAATPKFSLSYDISPNDTVYTTIAKGYRIGGPTGPASTSPCLALLASFGDTTPGGPTKYGADKLWSYEAGAKGRAMDGNLSYDVDGFYVDWTNIQQSIPLGGACGENVVQNAGNAESYGGEAQLTYRVVKGLTVGLNATITHTVFTQTTPLLAGIVAVGQDVPDVPRYQLTPSIDYNFVYGNGYAGFAHIDYTEVGPSHGTTLTSDPDYNQPAYGVMNANIGIDIDTLEVQLYAKNLLNDHTIIARPTVNYNEEGYTLRPLTVGVKVQQTF
jgi:outer membrane receptor protein involved in Fe transport